MTDVKGPVQPKIIALGINSYKQNDFSVIKNNLYSFIESADCAPRQFSKSTEKCVFREIVYESKYTIFARIPDFKIIW